MTACALPGYLPRYQPQNPAKSGDRWGWEDCQAFAAAMAGDFDTCGATVPTGGQVRSLSNEPVPDPKSPGLNLAQVDAALNRVGIDLEVRYSLPWDDFVRKIDKGEGAVLDIYYGPIADSRFDAGRGFRSNHAIFVPPGWGAMDPLADGRAKGVYKYSGEAYPQSLLRTAAGRLILDPSTNRRLGLGLVYAAFTRDRRATWFVRIPAHRDYALFTADDAKRTCKRTGTAHTGATGSKAWDCTPPRTYRTSTGATRILVRLLEGPQLGHWVNAKYSTEVP